MALSKLRAIMELPRQAYTEGWNSYLSADGIVNPSGVRIIDGVVTGSAFFLFGYSSYYILKLIQNFAFEDETDSQILLDSKGEKKKKLSKNFRVLLRLLGWLRPTLWRILAAMSLSVVGGLIDASKSLQMVQLVKTAVEGKSFSKLGGDAAKLLYIEAIDIFVSWFRSFLLSGATTDFFRKLKSKVFFSILQQELEYFDNNKFSKLKKILDTDTTKVSSFFTKEIPELFDIFSSIISRITVLWSKSQQMTILMLASTAVQIELTKLKHFCLHSLEGDRDDSKEEDPCTETLMNIRAVRVFGKEEEAIRKLNSQLYKDEEEEEEATAALEESYIKASLSASMLPRRGFTQFVISQIKDLYQGVTEELPELISTSWKLIHKSYWLINIWYGGVLSIGKQVEQDELQTLVELSAELYDAINELIAQGEETEEILGPAARIMDILERKPKISLKEGYVPPGGLKGDIGFESVCFTFQKGGIHTISNITLKIPSGKKIAIVGPSGSGKTTILALIHRFYDPSSGTITLDGRPLTEYKTSWYYKHVGYISQRPLIFNASIEENIKYGSPCTTRDDVVRVSKLLEIDDDFMKVGGFEAPISMLTPNQQQMVVIARLMLSAPAILLLDMPTSGLDLNSEQVIIKALQMLVNTPGRTSVIIPSRLSESAKCDYIYYIESGHIIEHGTHSELLERGGCYADLVKQQSTLDQDEANVELPHRQIVPLQEALNQVNCIVENKIRKLSHVDQPDVQELIASLKNAVAVMQRERERLAVLERTYQVVGKGDLYNSSNGKKKEKKQRKKDSEGEEEEEEEQDGIMLVPKAKREWSKVKSSLKALSFVNKGFK